MNIIIIDLSFIYFYSNKYKDEYSSRYDGFYIMLLVVKKLWMDNYFLICYFILYNVVLNNCF